MIFRWIDKHWFLAGWIIVMGGITFALIVNWIAFH